MGNIISTRNYEDRLRTISNVREAGLTVCTGGILGLGETREDRWSFLETLSELKPQPESVTINTLVKIKGTPLENQEDIDPVELIRVIATARIIMPQSMIRLSAGRKQRSPLEQFLSFYVGANSIFLGDKLLTSDNPELQQDNRMFQDMGLEMKRALDGIH